MGSGQFLQTLLAFFVGTQFWFSVLIELGTVRFVDVSPPRSYISRSSWKRLKPTLNDSKHMAMRSQRNRKLSSNTEYNIGIGGNTGKNYKFSGKQTQRWRKLDKNLHNYLVNLVDSGIKSVSSKPGFRKDEDVQHLLERLKTRLKGKLGDLKAPPTKHADYSQLRSHLTDLTAEMKQMDDHEVLLDREIRKEERLIEQLESNEAGQETDSALIIKIPEEQLDLPRLNAGIT